jgi:hypothetical protein
MALLSFAQIEPFSPLEGCQAGRTKALQALKGDKEVEVGGSCRTFQSSR